MILDTGMVSILRTVADTPSGNMYEDSTSELMRVWYGARTVGYNRHYAARQANTRIDMLIRILRPAVELRADDFCEIDGRRYRIIQAQYLFDDDAGVYVCDLSLERLGGKYDGN